MGAEFDSIKVDGSLNKEHIMEKWTAAVEQALYDYGHSGYSGTIAELAPDEIIWKEEEFDTEDEAEEFLGNNRSKWDPAWAVKFKVIVEEKIITKWMIGGCCSS